MRAFSFWGRRDRWVGCLIVLPALALLAACGGSGPARAEATALPTHTPPAATSTTVPSLTPTQTATAVPPTETPQPSPTSTPSPTLEPTAPVTSTPEISAAEGEVVYEKTLGTEVIRAAVPAEVVPILEAAGTEPGQVEEVDKAVWTVEENAVMLGKIPVFVKDGNEWRYNEQIIYEENYINLGPALVLPNVSSFENPELEEWPPAGVFIQNHPGFDTIDTAGQLAGGKISEVVLLRGSSTLETQRAYLEFKYKNPNSGRITSFWITQHNSIAVDNEERPFSSLPSIKYAAVIGIQNSRKSYPALKQQLFGTELGAIDITFMHTTILQGGVLPSTGAFMNIVINRY